MLWCDSIVCSTSMFTVSFLFVDSRSNYHLKTVLYVGYVARPKPEVFDITKRKFHNVLQGVAPPEVRLSEYDKQMFIDWSNENVERFWLGPKGPIMTSDVIVVDDPQRMYITGYAICCPSLSFRLLNIFCNSCRHHSAYQEAFA